jgi:Holliday junction resolvase
VIEPQKDQRDLTANERESTLMNSREKGKRGERQWRDELRANGYDARRGQQFSGSPDSPDVISEDLPWIHFEVKAVERLNIEDAMEQARRDCGRMASGGHKIPVVAHKRSFREWLVTMTAEVFFKFLRGDFTETKRTNGQPRIHTDEHRFFGDGVESIPTNNKQKTSS